VDKILAFAFVIIGVVGGSIQVATGSIFATASDNAGLVAGGAFTTLALAGFTLMWNTWRRENGRLTKFNSSIVKKLNRSERDKNLLIQLCWANGISIPESIWTDQEED